ISLIKPSILQDSKRNDSLFMTNFSGLPFRKEGTQIEFYDEMIMRFQVTEAIKNLSTAPGVSRTATTSFPWPY
ncbi:unnamed protein product, partial [Nesidiocoris tenuis]